MRTTLEVFQRKLAQKQSGDDPAEHQAELRSNDGDFSRFPGLRRTNPLQ